MRPRVFVDQATIYLKAGDGGNGCVAFRREKFVPHGGPSGGDGGDGGSIYVEGTPHLNTLFTFKKYPHQKAERGRHGSGNQRSGRSGGDTILEVPLGTIITNTETKGFIADLTQPGERILVAKGGRGGRGNARFATPTNQAPQWAEEGKPGEEVSVDLELKLMAQVGLIGLPNAGKSTLLSVLSSARPKIADYPFTTLTPQLGVIAYEDGWSLTISEIPGIIEGAHEGRGLGLSFLRHAERVQLLCHLVDVSDTADPMESLGTLEKELKTYGEGIASLPRILVASKLDACTRREEILEAMASSAGNRNLPLVAISAVTHEGITDLLRLLRERLP